MNFSIQEQLLHRNVQRFREGSVFKAHRLLYQSTLGSRAIQRKKKKKMLGGGEGRIQGVDVLCIGLTVNVCCWEGWGVEGVRV